MDLSPSEAGTVMDKQERPAETSAVETLLNQPPYGLDPAAKRALLLPALCESLVHHYEHCDLFRRWCEKRRFHPHDGIDDPAAVPFLPVGVFKRLLLRSTPEDRVVRVLTSSATTSQTPSQIVLDQVTRNRQMRALISILVHRLGGRRRPFIVLDVPPAPATADRELSARIAGMRGYLMAATKTEYVLRGDGDRPSLDIDKLTALVEQFRTAGEPFCLLGYTYLLYRYAVVPLREAGLRLRLPDDAAILHFGGWKKLRDQAVGREELVAQTAETFGVAPRAICDIYGFTEQLGVIYPDDAEGIKRVPAYSEVFVRDPRTLEIVPDGQTGFLEFVCPLPHSYPGVAVLLDDLGRIVTRRPGADGSQGTGFEVVGRAPQTESRGCGDTLPAAVYNRNPSP